MYSVIVELDVAKQNMELMDVANAVAVALANSPDLVNTVIRRFTVEEDS